ncbi:MAG: FHA domain-containing protein [Phycisphaerae bacterium]|jgi:hypothetical protein|nr:FHA domain-containing protein [Phycisphaerae bacterium]
MSEMNTPSHWPGSGSIRISSEEANSEHVDNLLQRQASLRGEGGITTHSRGKWYYQNWFLFMLTGMVAAFGAWAILEPYFDDMCYIQGTLEAVNVEDEHSGRISVGAQELTLLLKPKGWVKVNGEKVWMFERTKGMTADDKVAELDLSSLKVGQEIGVYVVPEPYMQMELALAGFIVPEPSANPPEKASYSLRKITTQTATAGMVMFAVVAAMIGLAIGASEGIICRIPRRAVIGGLVGLVVGFIGGFISGFLANIVYAPLNQMAMEQEGSGPGGLTTFAFMVQMGGRSLGWCLAGMTMGLGQGLSLRSGRLLLYGFLGGIIGGLLGGMVFDPVDLLLIGGLNHPSAHVSRMIGITVIGATVGAMIGLVELLARDAWLRMTEGPLAGKEFLIFKDIMHLGASPRSEVYLFNDDGVASQHATIRCSGDSYEIESLDESYPVYVNGRTVSRAKLRNGDQIALGRTSFLFQKRKR